MNKNSLDLFYGNIHMIFFGYLIALNSIDLNASDRLLNVKFESNKLCLRYFFFLVPIHR